MTIHSAVILWMARHTDVAKKISAFFASLPCEHAKNASYINLPILPHYTQCLHANIQSLSRNCEDNVTLIQHINDLNVSFTF